MFRRSSGSSAPSAEPDSAESAAERAGKGRPTPKRREAQAAQRASFIDRTTQRGGRGSRPSKEAVQARREAMRRGDENALSARDRGPVRRFARDVVDSRRNAGSLFIPVGFPVIIVTYVIPIAQLLLLALVLAIIIDSALLARRVRRGAQARFPDASAAQLKGLGLYAVLRALQFRRARVPLPRVSPGDKI